LRSIPSDVDCTVSLDLIPVESANCLHTPGYADDVCISSGCAQTSEGRRFPPLRILPRHAIDDSGQRFRVPSLSISMRDQSVKNHSQEAVAQQNIPMPKSTKVKNKLYLLEETVEKSNEIHDDRDVAGPSAKNLGPISRSSDSILYKWKVKRRCDGSRYIVKRPARSQILKKRAAQLVRERTGVSTDDDAMSELKLGHFHSREERKKHLEEERRRKIKNKQKIVESKISPTDQVLTDLFLSFYYIADGSMASGSVQYTISGVNLGWLFPIFRCNGACYNKFSFKKCCSTGLAIFLLVIIEDFLGQFIVLWVLGGFGVTRSTLKFFCFAFFVTLVFGGFGDGDSEMFIEADPMMSSGHISFGFTDEDFAILIFSIVNNYTFCLVNLNKSLVLIFIVCYHVDWVNVWWSILIIFWV
uniref:Transmembrane protein n=1 Tax=Angiostrongylus cantonensis TaxID=6313 RepID=A0A158PBZ3_ANGCA